VLQTPAVVAVNNGEVSELRRYGAVQRSWDPLRASVSTNGPQGSDQHEREGPQGYAETIRAGQSGRTPFGAVQRAPLLPICSPVLRRPTAWTRPSRWIAASSWQDVPDAMTEDPTQATASRCIQSALFDIILP
jgi:hypothetical protein